MTTKTLTPNMEIHKLYGGEVELCFNPTKHHYTVDGKTVHGVTSILGVIAKPALVYWSAKMAAEYVDANLRVGQALDEVQKMELVEGAKKAHRSFLKKAGDYGTLLHEAIERYIKTGKEEKFQNATLQKGYTDFLTWAKNNKVEFKLSEKKVYSRKYNFAGTLDFTAIVNGKKVVGDLKTSSGIWDEYWLQLAAYKHAIQEEFPQTKVDHTLIIRCGKDGAFEVQELDDFEKNIKAFEGACALYEWQKERKFKELTNRK